MSWGTMDMMIRSSRLSERRRMAWARLTTVRVRLTSGCRRLKAANRCGTKYLALDSTASFSCPCSEPCMSDSCMSRLSRRPKMSRLARCSASAASVR
ncbi:hypothetical protein D3C81_2064040 [compost metagenome]